MVREEQRFKTQILLLFAVILASCTSAAIPTVTSATKLVPTKTPIQTAYYKATSTLTPTSTSTPPTTQPTAAAAQTESVSPESEPVTFTGYVAGITEAGEIINTSTGDGGIFQHLYLLPDEIAALRFSVFQHVPYTNEVTPTATAIPTTAWRVLIYRYQTDGLYSNQPFIETELSRDVSSNELQTKYGDCRAFTFQIMDEQETLIWQGYFAFRPDMIFVKINTDAAFEEGVVLGYPYSLNENESAFFHEGKFIPIHEPQGGFYRLFYAFNFILATGESASSVFEPIASELKIRLFEYRADGQYDVSHSFPIIGKLILYVFTVELPIDYLSENLRDKNLYYLQIVDGEGKTIKDEYIRYIPNP